jgi:hypothetical protein
MKPGNGSEVGFRPIELNLKRGAFSTDYEIYGRSHEDFKQRVARSASTG